MSMSSIQAAKILVTESNYGLNKTQIFAMIFICDYVFKKRYQKSLINQKFIPHAFLPYNQDLSDKIFGYGNNKVGNLFRSVDIDNVNNLEKDTIVECYHIYHKQPEYTLISIVRNINRDIKYSSFC